MPGNGMLINNGEHNIIIDGRVCKPCGKEPLYVGKELQLSRFRFKDVNGVDRAWEGVEKVRKTTNVNNQISEKSTSVCTVAILRKQIMCDALILVKQYRAQLQAYTLEFPAKVLKADQNVTETANQEIRNDTGYTSTDINHISPPVAIDSVLSTDLVRLASVIIDGDDPLKPPHAQNSDLGSDSCGHGAVVEVIQVPINGLLDRLAGYHEKGIIIDSLVYMFAIGLKKGERLTLDSMVKEQFES